MSPRPSSSPSSRSRVDAESRSARRSLSGLGLGVVAVLAVLAVLALATAPDAATASTAACPGSFDVQTFMSNPPGVPTGSNPSGTCPSSAGVNMTAAHERITREFAAINASTYPTTLAYYRRIYCTRGDTYNAYYNAMYNCALASCRPKMCNTSWTDVYLNPAASFYVNCTGFSSCASVFSLTDAPTPTSGPTRSGGDAPKASFFAAILAAVAGVAFVEM